MTSEGRSRSIAAVASLSVTCRGEKLTRGQPWGDVPGVGSPARLCELLGSRPPDPVASTGQQQALTVLI